MVLWRSLGPLGSPRPPALAGFAVLMGPAPTGATFRFALALHANPEYIDNHRLVSLLPDGCLFLERPSINEAKREYKKNRGNHHVCCVCVYRTQRPKINGTTREWCLSDPTTKDQRNNARLKKRGNYDVFALVCSPTTNDQRRLLILRV